MKDTKHIVYLDETKMDGEHRKYFWYSVAIGAAITLVGGSCAFISLAVILNLIFE